METRISKNTLASSLWSLPSISWDPSCLYLCLCLCICVCICLWSPPWFTCAPSQSFRPTAEGVRWFLLWPPVPTRVDTHVNTEQPKAFPRLSHFDFIFKWSTAVPTSMIHTWTPQIRAKAFPQEFHKGFYIWPKNAQKVLKKEDALFLSSKKGLKKVTHVIMSFVRLVVFLPVFLTHQSALFRWYLWNVFIYFEMVWPGYLYKTGVGSVNSWTFWWLALKSSTGLNNDIQAHSAHQRPSVITLW